MIPRTYFFNLYADGTVMARHLTRGSADRAARQNGRPRVARIKVRMKQ